MHNDTTAAEVLLVEVLSDFAMTVLRRTEDFAAYEKLVNQTLKSAQRKAYKDNLETFDRELSDQVPKSWRFKRYRKRTIITLAGAVTFKRRIYIDNFGRYRTYLDEVLGIRTHSRFSKDAFLWIVRMAADVSYQKTADAFKKQTETEISKVAVMHIVHREGELLRELFGSKEALRDALGGVISNSALFAELDGFWVHLQSERKGVRMSRAKYEETRVKKSMEMKVWVCYGGKKDGKRLGTRHYVSISDPEDFRSECSIVADAAYDLDDVDYYVLGSDAASWCKGESIEPVLDASTLIVNKLDPFHINKKIRAAQPNRAKANQLVKLLRCRNYAQLFGELYAIEDNAETDKVKAVDDLKSYIINNIDMIDNSLSSCLRQEIASELDLVFAGESYLGHLHELLDNRRYKRFFATLDKIIARCVGNRKGTLAKFQAYAQDQYRDIKNFGLTTLGTLEGTNSKVYASRLKCWGGAWSEFGALAMGLIRAAIASGIELVAPGFNAYYTDAEIIQMHKHDIDSSSKVELKVGVGYMPPQGIFRPNDPTIMPDSFLYCPVC